MYLQTLNRKIMHITRVNFIYQEEFMLRNDSYQRNYVYNQLRITDVNISAKLSKIN